MQPIVVALVYGFSLALAAVLLYFFHMRWYWHVLSLFAALAIGLTPMPPEWRIPDLAVGFAFLFFFFWGIGAPLFRTHHAHSQTAHHA